jgi:Uncharacterised protein family (UPF0164)
MMNIKKYILFSIIMMLMLLLSVQAGDMIKKAQSQMQWLSIPVGPRASALGGAFTAMANDASSVFWNPAGIAFTTGGNVFLSQTKWFADISVNAAAAAYDAGNLGIFSLSFSNVDWGTFHGTRIDYDASAGYVETGDFSPTNWAIGLAYARRVSDRFAIGGNLKYLYENLGTGLTGTMGEGKIYTARMNLLALDIGTIYFTGYKDLRLAMSLQNFSQERQYREEKYPLPLTFKFGVAMDLASLWMQESEHKLTLAVDAIHPRDYSERLCFGLEYGFKNMVFLRGGYKTNYDEQGLTLGAGLQYNIDNLGLGIDYGYIQFKHFDAVQMFGISFKF